MTCGFCLYLFHSFSFCFSLSLLLWFCRSPSIPVDTGSFHEHFGSLCHSVFCHIDQTVVSLHPFFSLVRFFFIFSPDCMFLWSQFWFNGIILCMMISHLLLYSIPICLVLSHVLYLTCPYSTMSTLSFIPCLSCPHSCYVVLFKFLLLLFLSLTYPFMHATAHH